LLRNSPPVIFTLRNRHFHGKHRLPIVAGFTATIASSSTSDFFILTQKRKITNTITEYIAEKYLTFLKNI